MLTAAWSLKLTGQCGDISLTFRKSSTLTAHPAVLGMIINSVLSFRASLDPEGKRSVFASRGIPDPSLGTALELVVGGRQAQPSLQISTAAIIPGYFYFIPLAWAEKEVLAF